jgi:PfaB family protein
MQPSKLAIAGLSSFFNQLLSSQQLSALIYQGKPLDYANKPISDHSWSILSKMSHQALKDCTCEIGEQVALVTINNISNHQDVELEKMSQQLERLWSCSILQFQLNQKTDSLFKSLELAQILLTSKEVDTVIISAINTASESIIGGSLILKDSETLQDKNTSFYGVIDSFNKIVNPLSSSSIAIKQSCQQAFEKAKVKPSEIGYLEVSPAEIDQGLIEAYSIDKNDLTCAVGTVQVNINNLGITEDLISLIKTAICLKNCYLPASSQPFHSHLSQEGKNSPFYLSDVSLPWFLKKGQEKRYAALNLVASNNTYSHLILSEATPQSTPKNDYLPHASFYLFPITGNDRSSLQSQLDNLTQNIENSFSLPHLAKENFIQFQQSSQSPYVVAIVGDNKEALQKEIKQAKKGIDKAFQTGKSWKSPKGSYFTPKQLGKMGKVAFVYPGAFNSYLGMGRNLFQLFPKLWERANNLISDSATFFQANALYPKSQSSLSKQDLETLETQFMANPLSLLETGTGFAVLFTEIMQQYFQIKPHIAFGYSMGESTMMYSLGVWPNADQGSQFVHSSPLFHNRLIGSKQAVADYWGQTIDENSWSSYVLMATPEAVQDCLKGENKVYLTHINTPQEVAIAGDPQGCLRVIEQLQCDGFRSPSDMVLHCKAMQSEYNEFLKLNTVTMGTLPDTLFYSSSNYDSLTLEQEKIAHHLSKGMCQMLDFPRLIERTYQDGARIFLELGSGGSCSRWISETLDQKEHLALCINRRGADDLATIIKMLAQLVSHGVELDLSPLYLADEVETLDPIPYTVSKSEIELKDQPQNSISKERASQQKVAALVAPNGESITQVQTIPTLPTVIPSPSKPHKTCLFDEPEILEFIEGKVSKVFGQEYEPIDHYTQRVRMPSPPFLFVSRVTQLEGKLGDYKSGFIETEYDVPEDAWYGVDGQLTVGICKEAGHGLLMLLSYIGTDFENQGKRSFRLLDLSATFLFEQPENVKLLRCRVKITSSVKTDDSLLIFFQGEVLIGDQVWMKLHDGCAGLFSDVELEKGQGIVPTEAEEKERSLIQKQQFTSLLTCPKSSFLPEDILNLSRGKIDACFGENYQQTCLNASLRLPPKKLLMLEQVMMINPQGGIAGLGFAVGSKQVTPDDWYYSCHFRNDPTLPGNLMIEGSIQLVQFYCLWLGLQTHTKDARFQVIPNKTQAARFRGQVTPLYGTLIYQMDVLLIGLSPQPYLVANVDVIFGGKTIATIKNIGVQLVEKSATLQHFSQPIESSSVSFKPEKSAPIQNVSQPLKQSSVLFDENQLKTFAQGSVAACLGSEFDIYENRQSVRLPNGEFQLVSRVLDIDGKRHELQKPSEIITEFDVKENAWFYDHNSYPTLPYCTYIEIAGQPCIFLGVYMGATLLSPQDDLHFRNLDGQGTILKEVDLRNKTITDKVRLISTTAIQGAIIQKFEFELSCDGEPFYRGNMVFGDFSTSVLANQVGLDGGKCIQPWYQLNDLSDFTVEEINLQDSFVREKFYQVNPEKPHYRLSQNYLDFIENVFLIEGGGKYQKGYIYASKSITPEDWYFPFHFYQDPVMPGALGVESILQAMQTYALQLDLGKSLKNPRFGQALNHQITWKYRGQITPENHSMSLEVHISDIRVEDDVITIIGDASLWKEDLRIYEIKDIALCLLDSNQ